MNKFVFVDLDETLIHAEYNVFSNNRTIIELNIDSGGWGGNITERYGVLLRPNACEFLKKLRLLYPNVYMLTAATSYYGVEMNKVFDLGFTDDQIIGRDLWNGLFLKINGHHIFTTEPCCSVLLDNNDPSMPTACYKINYLEKFGKASYIKVDDFYGSETDQFTNKMINGLLKKVEKAFNLMQP